MTITLLLHEWTASKIFDHHLKLLMFSSFFSWHLHSNSHITAIGSSAIMQLRAQIKFEFKIHTLGKSGTSDRISEGVIVGYSCCAADGPALLMAIKYARPLGNRISEASLLLFFSVGDIITLKKDAYFSKHITNCIGTGCRKSYGEMSQRDEVSGDSMQWWIGLCQNFTIELRQKTLQGGRQCLNHKEPMCWHTQALSSLTPSISGLLNGSMASVEWLWMKIARHWVLTWPLTTQTNHTLSHHHSQWMKSTIPRTYVATHFY